LLGLAWRERAELEPGLVEDHAIAGRVAQENLGLGARTGAGVLHRDLQAVLLALLDEAVAVRVVDELPAVREDRPCGRLDVNLGGLDLRDRAARLANF